MKTLYDVIAEALEASEFDGLVNPTIQCGCLKGDLMPCDEPHLIECQPGYLIAPNDDAKGDGATWCIYGCKQGRDNAVEKGKVG